MDLQFRTAVIDDVPLLVQMLADDPLGKQREKWEDPLPRSYCDAFGAIDRDSNNELVVAIHGGQIVGFLQITFIPYLTYQGRWRALVEGVRVQREFRGRGIGRQIFQWAIERARQRGCHLIQLTSDKQRPGAIQFYESLGFVASHEGMKLHLG